MGDTELRFDVLDDAAVLDEDLDEGQLVSAEALEAPELKAPLDLGVAAPAVEPGYCQLVSAHGAATDDRVQRHSQGSLIAQILRRHPGGRRIGPQQPVWIDKLHLLVDFVNSKVAFIQLFPSRIRRRRYSLNSTVSACIAQDPFS